MKVIQPGYEISTENRSSEEGPITIIFTVDQKDAGELYNVAHLYDGLINVNFKKIPDCLDIFHGDANVIFVHPKQIAGAERSNIWYDAMLSAEKYYMQLMEKGCTPWEASIILPYSAKTTVSISFQINSLLRLKKSKHYQAQLYYLFEPLFEELEREFPKYFGLFVPINNK